MRNKSEGLDLSVLDQAGIMAYTDQFGNYKYVNNGWEKATGISAKDAVGKNVESLLEGSGIMLCLRTGRVITDEMYIRTISKRDLSCIMRYRPIIDSQKNISGCLATSVFETLDDAQNFTEDLNRMLEEFEYLKNTDSVGGGAKYTADSIIGESRAIKNLKEQIYIAGASNASCLIEGETGTGKELVAHAIHNASMRRLFPFARVNCSAIPENLMESEFFGYEEGSFTGGVKGGKAGKFEKAHLGSMFLDEVNAMSLSMQPKFLRVLQEKEIERIGGTESIPVDVRVIAASNMPLEMLVWQGKFRQDLLYRLNIITISIPPLRDRKEDIRSLVELRMQANRKSGLGHAISISDDAVEYLMGFDWPGNVRELQNRVDRAMASSWDECLEISNFVKFEPSANVFGKTLYGGKLVYPGYSQGKEYNSEPDSVPVSFEGRKNAENADEVAVAPERKYLSELKGKKENLEKEAIIEALTACGGNKAKAARMLDISRTLLYKKLEKYNLA